MCELFNEIPLFTLQELVEVDIPERTPEEAYRRGYVTGFFAVATTDKAEQFYYNRLVPWRNRAAPFKLDCKEGRVAVVPRKVEFELPPHFRG